jgi:uncharacterized protein
MDEITLSIDGDHISHDLQRPAKNGHGTFRYVYATGKTLLSRGRVFNLRTTVTSLNVGRLEEIVSFLITEFPGCSVNVEPVTLVGRAFEHRQLMCEPILFADHLYRALRIGIDRGATVFYSGVAGHSQRQEFCAASAPSFCVSPDGSVTSCFSYSRRDNIKDLFIYGSYNAPTNRFEFNEAAIERLRSLSMEHDAYCDGCFCRSHCIGDCPAIRRFQLNEDKGFVEELDLDFLQNRRCATNRRVVRLILNDLARGRIKPSGQAPVPLGSSPVQVPA